MCGISLTLIGSVDTTLFPVCLDPPGTTVGTLVSKRGPDAEMSIAVTPTVTLTTAVLHLRGDVRCDQPVNLSNIVFSWNGELFGGPLECAAESDTKVIADHIHQMDDLGRDLFPFLRLLEGPFSCVVVDKSAQMLYFARDPRGRRSLIVHRGVDTFHLASVGLSGEEVPPIGLYCLNLATLQLDLCAWSTGPEWNPFTVPSRVFECRSFPRVEHEEDDGCGDDEGATDSFLGALHRAVQVRMPRAGAPSVLFSGGVDSALLAALVHACTAPDCPIDLLNVSFAGETAPDRQTGLATLEELRHLAPRREWRFVRIDVTDAEWKAEQEHILTLCAPCNTVMDINIGTALWFASRGRGTCNGEPYMSEPRVVLSGHGADEQCGGYKRHRTKYEHGGWDAVAAELALDQTRIWSRNMGRDDRLVADHGKELRCPFLDINVSRALSGRRLQTICNFDSPQGDKHVIRRSARRVGLAASSRLDKRAIQFGSTIAKVYRLSARREGVEQKGKGQGDNTYRRV